MQLYIESSSAILRELNSKSTCVRMMETTKFIWKDGKLVAWEDALVHVLTHTLHYGAGVFEGIRCYKTDTGTAIFRLPEHIDRLVYSAKAIGMTIPFSREQLIEATIETVRENNLEQGYIRPLVYYGYGVMGLNPRNAPVEAIIACWPWGAYLPHDMVDLKTSSFIRIHPRSTVADAKIVGHYVNSILSVLELKGTKYHEALLLDFEGNVAEGPGENLFLVKEGSLVTPKLGTILAGITRNTIMDLCSTFGLSVEEKIISPGEVLAADEAFYTGTAAEVTPIRSLDDTVIGKGEVGPITAKLRDAYLEIVQGKKPEFEKYLTRV